MSNINNKVALNRCFKRFKHKLTIQQDTETIEISTEIKRNKTSQSSSNLNSNEDAANNNHLDDLSTQDRVKSSIVYDSMKTYLNNITNVAVNSVYPNTNFYQTSANDNHAENQNDNDDSNSEEDETSIREHILITSGQENRSNSNNYEIHQINNDERAEEIDKINNLSPIIVNNIPILVEQKNPNIKEFDQTVAIVDSVVIDHLSEDDKSVSSEEVTFERWTEETRIYATKVFDKDGQVVDEIIQQTSPELIGNILREKLIERHEHITHKSHDIKKLVKCENRETSDLDVIIVEPTHKSLLSNLENNSSSYGTQTKLDNKYFIQHQQIITPSQHQARITDESEQENDAQEIKFEMPKLRHLKNDMSNIHTFYGGYEACTKLFDSADEDEQVENNENLEQEQHENVLIIDKNNNNDLDLDSLNENEFPLDFNKEDDNNEDNAIKKRNEIIKMQYNKITSLDASPSNNNNETSSDSLESMERFERPTKSEMKLTHNNNKVISYLNEQQNDDSLNDQDIEEDEEFDLNNFSSKSFEQKLLNFKLEMQQNQFEIEKLNQDLLNSKVDLNNLTLKEEDVDEENLNSTPKLSDKIEFTKQETADVTDISDDEHNTIFKNARGNDNKDEEKPQTVRSFPLRRESFEMAQNQDSTFKRLSISALAAAVSSSSASNKTTPSSSSTSSTSSTSSMSGKHLKTRFIPEINPKQTNNLTSSKNMNTIQNLNNSKEQEQEQNEAYCCSSSSVCSDETAQNLLERNYELIKRKTSEKLNKLVDNNNNNTTTTNTTSMSLYENVNENNNIENINLNIGQPSFVSSHSVKSLDNHLLNVNTTNKSDQEHYLDSCCSVSSQSSNTPVHSKRIKVVKKQKTPNAQNNLKTRSISPASPAALALLKRGPDIIETIETTTSMSFIMNKKIDLIVEEKRVPPSTRRGTSPLSYCSNSSTESPKLQQHPEVTKRINNDERTMRAVPIPIHVQSRSKSEPKRHQNHQTIWNNIELNNKLLVDTPSTIATQTNRYSNATTSSSSNMCSPRISFHKYDSNEIIAVVNVPEARQLTTLHAALNNSSNSSNEFIKRQSDFIFPNKTTNLNHQNSKSVPNLNKKTTLKQFDTWRNWPEYAVEQDTDTSIISSNYNSNSKTRLEESDSRIWFKHPSNQQQKGVEFDIEIEKKSPAINSDTYLNRTSVSVDGQPVNAKITSNPDGGVSIENVSFIPGNEILIQSDINNSCSNVIHRAHLHETLSSTIQTRMSSGYFSGDEFHKSFTQHQQQQGQYDNVINNTSSNPDYQFNINKFLNNNTRKNLNNKYKRDAIDELNRLYNSLGLEEDDALYETANSHSNSIANYGTYSNSNLFRRVPIQTIKTNSQYFENNKKDDMAARKLNNDDYSFYNLRKRSSSCTSLANNNVNNLNNLNDSMNTTTNSTTNNPLLILPSPTCADYLRNKTRESALINVVMNPVKTSTDYELSQILYDDMAFRQLRKDSEAHKLSQIKSIAQPPPQQHQQQPSYNLIKKNIKKTYYNPTPQFPSCDSMINITTLPNSSSHSIFHEESSSSSFLNNNIYHQPDNVESVLNNSTNSGSSSIVNKTVKMLKQKKDSQKRMMISSSNNHYDRVQNIYENNNNLRYHTHELMTNNEEINEYYDYLNPIQPTTQTYSINNRNSNNDNSELF